jgi:hypothetical protein
MGTLCYQFGSDMRLQSPLPVSAGASAACAVVGSSCQFPIFPAAGTEAVQLSAEGLQPLEEATQVALATCNTRH